MLKGVDVSSHRGTIAWARSKAAGVQFAIIRGGYGSNILNEATTAITDDYEQDDSQYENNVAGCEANGIDWGMYLYSYACNLAQSDSEVDHALRLLRGKKPTGPIVLDMEDSDHYKANHGVSNQMWNDVVYNFCSKMEAAGYYVMFYSNKNDRENILTDPRLDRFDFWLAQWNVTDDYKGQHGMWQYADDGSVDGINGHVDMDQTTDYRDYPTYIKEHGLNGWGNGSAQSEQAVPAPAQPVSVPSVSSAPTQTTQHGPNPTLIWDYQYDAAIADLQRILNAKGHSLAIDGKAGNNTYSAVKGYTISNGDRGPLTKWVQHRINSLGFNSGIVDGIAGDNTMSGIAAFQKDHGLGQGYLGGTDWYYLIR